MIAEITVTTVATKAAYIVATGFFLGLGFSTAYGTIELSRRLLKSHKPSVKRDILKELKEIEKQVANL